MPRSSSVWQRQKPPRVSQASRAGRFSQANQASRFSKAGQTGRASRTGRSSQASRAGRSSRVSAGQERHVEERLMETPPSPKKLTPVREPNVCILTELKKIKDRVSKVR